MSYSDSLTAIPLDLAIDHEPGDKEKSKKIRKPRRKRLHCFILYFIGMVSYTLLGGLIFWALEKHESEKINAEFHNRCVQLKINHSLAFASKFKSDSHVSTINLDEIFAHFNRSIEEVYKCMKEYYPTYAIPQPFNFISSTMYAVTVYTTVGYGNIVTRTSFGHFVTIGYGFIGIPLYIAFISDFGDFLGKKFIVLSVWLRNLILRLIKRRKLTDEEKRKTPSSIFRFIFITIILTMFTLTITLVIQHIEKLDNQEWSYMDSLHFVFSTISLIGFGDIVASHELYLAVYLPLFIIGQSLCALSFYFIQRFIRYDIPQFITKCCIQMFQPTIEEPSDNDSDNEFDRKENPVKKVNHFVPCIPHESESNSTTRSLFARASKSEIPYNKVPNQS